MADIGQELEGGAAEANSERIPEDQHRQEVLLRLAERTVLHAENLAQEITDRAKRDGEAEAAKLRAQYTAEGKEDARRIIQSAEQQCVSLKDEATAKAQAESEAVLGRAQTEGQEIVSNSRAEAQEIVRTAKAESQEIKGKARAEGQEVLATAQRDAEAVVNAAQARADSVESNAGLRAEFNIRQMSQTAVDGIRRMVMETLLPSLDEFGKQIMEKTFSDHTGRDAVIEKELPEKVVFNETKSDSNGMEEASPTTGTHTSDYPSGT